MSTLERIRRAYENLSDDDKKKFHQSISARVHESIGEQEHDDGNEDGQPAEAREHEALGEEHADGKGDVRELHEIDEETHDKPEKSSGNDGSVKDGIIQAIKSMREQIAMLSARMDLIERTPQKADDGVAEKLNKIANLYNN